MFPISVSQFFDTEWLSEHGLNPSLATLGASVYRVIDFNDSGDPVAVRVATTDTNGRHNLPPYPVTLDPGLYEPFDPRNLGGTDPALLALTERGIGVNFGGNGKIAVSNLPHIKPIFPLGNDILPTDMSEASVALLRTQFRRGLNQLANRMHTSSVGWRGAPFADAANEVAQSKEAGIMTPLLTSPAIPPRGSRGVPVMITVPGLVSTGSGFRRITGEQPAAIPGRVVSIVGGIGGTLLGVAELPGNFGAIAINSQGNTVLMAEHLGGKKVGVSSTLDALHQRLQGNQRATRRSAGLAIR